MKRISILIAWDGAFSSAEYLSFGWQRPFHAINSFKCKNLFLPVEPVLNGTENTVLNDRQKFRKMSTQHKINLRSNHSLKADQLQLFKTIALNYVAKNSKSSSVDRGRGK